MASASPSLIGFFVGIGGAESYLYHEFTVHLTRMPSGRSGPGSLGVANRITGPGA
jgi:hypothetical protein